MKLADFKTENAGQLPELSEEHADAGSQDRDLMNVEQQIRALEELASIWNRSFPRPSLAK